MTAAILQQLEGMSRVEAVKVILAVLHEITAGLSSEDLPGIVPPVKVRKRDFGRFAPVWEYLETVPEFTTQRALRTALVARFGEKGTPGKTYLSRYLKETRGVKHG